MLQTALQHMPFGNLLHQSLQGEPLGRHVWTGLVVLQVPRLQEGGKKLLSRVFHRGKRISTKCDHFE